MDSEASSSKLWLAHRASGMGWPWHDILFKVLIRTRWTYRRHASLLIRAPATLSDPWKVAIDPLLMSFYWNEIYETNQTMIKDETNHCCLDNHWNKRHDLLNQLPIVHISFEATKRINRKVYIKILSAAFWMYHSFTCGYGSSKGGHCNSESVAFLTCFKIRYLVKESYMAAVRGAMLILLRACIISALDVAVGSIVSEHFRVATALRAKNLGSRSPNLF